jgi:hypothetical protein
MATLAVIGFDIGKDVWRPSMTLMSAYVVTIAGHVEANRAIATLVLAFDTGSVSRERGKSSSRPNPMRSLLSAQPSTTLTDLCLVTTPDIRADALRADPGRLRERPTLNGRRRDALFPRSPIAFLTSALHANVVYAHLNLIEHRGFGMYSRAPVRIIAAPAAYSVTGADNQDNDDRKWDCRGTAA